MADTPICVILDGERFPDDVRAAYDVQVVRRDEVEPAELRAASFGSLRAKNVALWASPFETFLLLDADAIVWGDMRELAAFDHFDFLLDSGGEPPRSVMDVEAVAHHVPTFDAARNAPRFANTGAFLGRRGLLDLERYLELMHLSHAHPRLFYGSQGLFNLLVLEGADRGEIRVGHRELQVMTGRSAREDVVARFSFADSRPQVTGDPVVLHWVGSPKPRIRERKRDYFEPMTYFRREAWRASHGRTALGVRDDLRLRFEDMRCSDWRGTNLRGRLARLRRRAKQRWAIGKVTIRRRTPDRIVNTVRRRSQRGDKSAS